MKQAQMIAARVMHDLSAPVSAAGMGFSVLQQDRSDHQAFHITEQSIRNLQATLNFLRALFATEEPLPWSFMDRILHMYAQTRDTTLTCPEGHALPEYWSSILPFLCLIAMDAFVGQKRLDVIWNNTQLTIQGQGATYALSPDILEILGTQKDIHHFTAQSVHIYVLNRMLDRYNLSLRTQKKSHKLEIMISR